MQLPTPFLPMFSGFAIVWLSIHLSSCGKTTSERTLDSVETPTEEITNTPALDSEQMAKLQREIKQHEQTIGDLEAAVVMERAKLQDNPDYDRSFLNECLQEQDENRLKIEQIQQRLKTLSSE